MSESDADASDTIPLRREAIESAHAALQEHLFETPTLPSPDLSEATGLEVRLKAENIQRAGSFKVRGSVNKLRKLAAEGGIEEVTTASAGNHAQGLAYAAARLGIRSTIFMPEDAPLAKRRATQRLGAQLQVRGRNYDEARALALEYARERDLPFVDGFDDWDVIEGQATLGVEIAADFGERPPNLVLVPAGGGGLLAGVAFYLKAVYGDATRVIGVQSERAPALTRSFQLARSDGDDDLPLHVDTRPTIADGIRIGRPGVRPFRVIRRHVDELVCVPEEEIYDAIVYLYEHSRLVVEGAGAVGVAALLGGSVRPEPGAGVAIVLSGGNVDLAAMQKIIASYLHKSHRRVVFRMKVKDVPGQLARIVRIFEREKINVAAIEQPPILVKPYSPEYTVFDICVETEGEEQMPEVINALEAEREKMRGEGQEPFEILER